MIYLTLRVESGRIRTRELGTIAQAGCCAVGPVAAWIPWEPSRSYPALLLDWPSIWLAAASICFGGKGLGKKAHTFCRVVAGGFAGAAKDEHGHGGQAGVQLGHKRRSADSGHLQAGDNEAEVSGKLGCSTRQRASAASATRRTSGNRFSREDMRTNAWKGSSSTSKIVAICPCNPRGPRPRPATRCLFCYLFTLRWRISGKRLPGEPL